MKRRRAWAAYVAPVENLLAFIDGRYEPSPDAVIRQLESKHELPPVLSKIKREGWSAMSAFVHGGAIQVQRWVGDGIIEPQHSDAEVLEVLAVADRLAFAACVLFVDVANADAEGLASLAEEFLTQPECDGRFRPKADVGAAVTPDDSRRVLSPYHSGPNSINNVLALAFGLLIVVLLVFGSLWIIHHLNHNMLTMDQIMRMQR